MVGTETQPSILIQIMQVIIAMFVMDTWQYFVHRYMHINKFLYRHIHSQHHRLVVPYAIGALYNHPLEGLLLDTVGGAISFLISGMTARTAVIFFYFATVKTVDDHCGLWLPEEDVKNAVPLPSVVKGVLVHQLVQAVVAHLLFLVTSDTGMVGTETQPSIIIQIVQVIIAMFVMDTWQYFVHRYMHINKFLYRHIHSQHHRLVVPYAIGALYNHPLEGLLLDTIGGAISFLISGMTARTAVIFFCFATVKTVDDHCGLWLPGNDCKNPRRHNSSVFATRKLSMTTQGKSGLWLPDVKFKTRARGNSTFPRQQGADMIPYEKDVTSIHDKVDVNESKSSVGSRSIVYLIKKEESKWWNRLLKQEGKTPAFVKVDWDKWVDEDEQDEKADMDFGDIDFSNLTWEAIEDESDTEEE
ncbi:sphinganine C4-monooxygenase 1-like protein [Tanacetum coccineum]